MTMPIMFTLMPPERYHGRSLVMIFFCSLAMHMVDCCVIAYLILHIPIYSNVIACSLAARPTTDRRPGLASQVIKRREGFCYTESISRAFTISKIHSSHTHFPTSNQIQPTIATTACYCDGRILCSAVVVSYPIAHRHHPSCLPLILLSSQPTTRGFRGKTSSLLIYPIMRERGIVSCTPS